MCTHELLFLLCITVCSTLYLAIYKLDGRRVVFGKVLTGMDVVYKIEVEGKQNGTPKSKVAIADSGELPLSSEAM